MPEDEIARRRDFREKCVFTIDPATARDLDDALHIEKMPNGKYEINGSEEFLTPFDLIWNDLYMNNEFILGNYELGVHIADVSYFVRPNSETDKVSISVKTSLNITIFHWLFESTFGIRAVILSHP